MTAAVEIDYEATARLAFDVPLDADACAALRVWADLLEARGDPRGPLIAIEHAIITDRHERNRLMLARSAELLPGFAAALEVPRAVVLDWRAGALYAATVDTRQTTRVLDAKPAEVISALLEAPAAGSLRRLVVRVRKDNQVAPIVRAITQLPVAQALEQVAVLGGPFPNRSSPYGGEHADLLLRHAPRLWSCAVAYVQVGSHLGDCTHADPATPEGRRAIGRALFDAQHRAIAHARIAQLGPRALAFVDALAALLAPGVSDELGQLAACRCLAAIGAGAAAAIPLLRKITGRTESYEAPTRRAAGQALAALV